MNRGKRSVWSSVLEGKAVAANTDTKGKKVATMMLALLVAVSVITGGVQAGASAQSADRPPIIYIDPGHQERGNNDKEPLAPGSSELKPKVATGTKGVATGKPEYVLVLEVSMRIKDKLEAKGYSVAMTRQTHDVDISNKERAELANNAGADLLVRIHADGHTSSKTRGASVLYPDQSVSATAELYERSKAAAGIILADMIAETEAKSRGIVARDDLSGFNWSTVPNVLIEMGFMTNPEEDRLLSTPDYQDKMAEGIAAGVDRYITEVAGKSPWNPQPHYEMLTLHDYVHLYDHIDGKLVPLGAYLSQQDVFARERTGDWFRIDTWFGSAWIRLTS